MSLNTFKRKSVIQYGSKRSAKPPGGYWMPQGPFGRTAEVLQSITNLGPVGFSLNGSHRNVGYIGKSSAFSRNGTPYRGKYALGSGGVNNRYPRGDPVFNSNRVIVLGDQWQYVKPSVLSNKGMLEKKYRWVYTGKYPNYWVQPNYAGTTQSDTKSQGLYLHNLTTSNTIVTDINGEAKYVGYFKRGGPTLCQHTTARFVYDDAARNGPYSKQLRQPETASQHTLRIQRRCTDPFVFQRPFPYATNGDACGNTNNTFDVPPVWYTTENSNQQNTRKIETGAAN